MTSGPLGVKALTSLRRQETVRLMTGATDQLIFRPTRTGKTLWTTFLFFEVSGVPGSCSWGLLEGASDFQARFWRMKWDCTTTETKGSQPTHSWRQALVSALFGSKTLETASEEGRGALVVSDVGHIRIGVKHSIHVVGFKSDSQI